MKYDKKISIILPCLNEENGLKVIIPEIYRICTENNFEYEIVLVDNNSTDNSINVFNSISKDLGIQEKTKVFFEKNPGYGSAYHCGFKNATGEICIMADADGSYDFKNIPSFIDEIKNYDLVIGNRFSGKMDKNAMPILNKFLGNPILSFLVRLFFKVKVKDIHSGMRAIKRDSYFKLNLYTRGMEFASEMIIQASKKNLRISEIDINYRNREGHSKLKAFRDGWKHLRFILLYASDYVFLIPGIIIFFVGGISLLISLFENHKFKVILLIILGFQMIFFSIFNKFYTITHLGEKDYLIEKLSKYITIEKIVTLCLLFFILGIFLSFINISIAFIIVIISIITFFSSLSISIIGIKE